VRRREESLFVDATLDLLTLALLPEVGPRSVRALRQRGALRDVLAAAREHADLLGAEALAGLASGRARRAAEAELAAATRQGLRIVGLDEPDYPSLLAQIYDPPPVLYVRGRLAGDDATRGVAVVGSRAASPQGLALAQSLARELAGWGVSVVSGLARGVDSAAHRGALEAGGRTLAVLGSALDRLYPRENERLAASIAERGGAVVSEFRLGTPPSPGHFPRRNRVIAGWSRAVVVVEAAQRSGALVTAREALDAGREVLAVPGHPSFPLAAGTNALIRDGARLVRHARDVAEELGFEPPATRGEPKSDKDEDAVLGVLRREAPASVDEIQARSGRPLSEVLARLAELELRDEVRRLPGALFVRSGKGVQV
jgi:DNA processing protein